MKQALKEFLATMAVLLAFVALGLAAAAPSERYMAPIDASSDVVVDEPDSPELLVTPCEIGPKTVPIVSPERIA